MGIVSPEIGALLRMSRSRWREIAEGVAKIHGTTFERAIAKGRGSDGYLAVRVAIARAIRSETGSSTTAIGRRINRDHTTVCWYLGLCRGRKAP